MRCKTCHYSLLNLTKHCCPECGNPFDPTDSKTFSTPRTVNEILDGRAAGIVMLSIVAILMIALTTCLASVIWGMLTDD